MSGTFNFWATLFGAFLLFPKRVLIPVSFMAEVGVMNLRVVAFLAGEIGVENILPAFGVIARLYFFPPVGLVSCSTVGIPVNSRDHK